MEIRLEVDVPMDTIRELRHLKNNNLPGSVAIDQARSMYPWVDRLFEKLCSKIDSLPRKQNIKRAAFVELEVDVPMETLGQLTRLERMDLEPSVAIDQARSMYPWIDQLFGELCKKANAVIGKYHERVLYYSLFNEDIDAIFQEASAGMFLDKS